MAGMLELLDQKSKTTMMKVLRSLMDKADTRQEQKGNPSKKNARDQKC
jgi:hypothetical protein